MMTTKNLVIVGASLLSLNSFAVVCTSQMTNSYGQVVREINMSGVDSREACKEAMKACRLALRQMQRNAQMNAGDCQSLGVGPSYPGNNDYPDNPGTYSYEVAQIKRVLQTGGWRARQSAVSDLKNYPSLEALKLAIKTVADNDSDVRAAALSSVYSLSDSVVVTAYPQDVLNELTPLTKNSNWKVRLLAVKAMAKMQSAIGVLVFIDLKGDLDSDVRAAATSALNKSIQAQDLKEVVRDLKSKISYLLKDSNWNTRLAAVKILGKAQIRSSVNDVVMATGDNDSDVRSAAKMALNEILSLRTYENLRLNKINELKNIYNSSYSWNVRISAVKALGATLNPVVKNILYKALDDSDSDVRNEARVQLRKF